MLFYAVPKPCIHRCAYNWPPNHRSIEMGMVWSPIFCNRVFLSKIGQVFATNIYFEVLEFEKCQPLFDLE